MTGMYTEKYASVEKWALDHDEDPRKTWKSDINNWDNCAGWDSYCQSVTGLIHYFALDLRTALDKGDVVEVARLQKQIGVWNERYERANEKRMNPKKHRCSECGHV